VEDRARRAEDRVKIASGRTVRFVLEVVAAIVVGAGVPLLWIWIGSQIQGSRGAQSVEAGTAVIMVVGILVSYAAVLIVAGMIQGREGRSSPRQPTRYPWLRSMRDEPYRPGTGKLSPVEAVFVGTAIVASIAMLIWFFALAGSPLPS
jgi:multisubunit Na+/H+ antiporter MnhC subunit